MGTLFLVCAILGGTVLVLQLLLGLVGVGMDAVDFHLDKDGIHASDALNLLSARSLAAALAFFGVGGLAALSLGFGSLVALPVGLALGSCAAVGTAALMRGLALMESDGAVRLDRALGESGTVYLSIPGNRAGAGKVLLTVQNRTVECQAVTSLDGLPTGTPVIVVDVLGPDTVEVAPVPTLGGLLDVPS
jgi:hypothetical protein